MNKEKQKFYNLINLLFYLVAIFLIILIIFSFFSKFPNNSYETVANRWFKYLKVLPPKDYNAALTREIGIDFIAPKEIDKSSNENFYWIVNSGDLITITNPNFKVVNGNLSFTAKGDPCGNSRNVIVSTQNEPINLFLNKKESISIEIPVEIKPNSSVFFSIAKNDNLKCFVNNLDTRNFVFKIINPKFTLNE